MHFTVSSCFKSGILIYQISGSLLNLLTVIVLYRYFPAYQETHPATTFLLYSSFPESIQFTSFATFEFSDSYSDSKAILQIYQYFQTVLLNDKTLLKLFFTVIRLQLHYSSFYLNLIQNANFLKFSGLSLDSRTVIRVSRSLLGPVIQVFGSTDPQYHLPSHFQLSSSSAASVFFSPPVTSQKSNFKAVRVSSIKFALQQLVHLALIKLSSF